MNVYESSQDYLERILILKSKMKKVRSIDVATDMGYTKQSISRAIKKLRESNLITVDVQGYIDFLPEGKLIAEKMYERHLLLTNYFISIGVSEKQALIDACKIEHDLSDETFEAIKSKMKR